MQARKRLALSAAGVALATMTPLALTAASGTSAFAASTQKNFVRTITQRSVAPVSHAAGTAATSAVQYPEFGASVGEGNVAAGSSKSKGNGADRSHAARVNKPPVPTSPVQQTLTAPTTNVDSGFEGLNLYQQRRVADNGNQFTVEPPDQGLCVGNGYVVETVNDVTNIFSADTHQPIVGQLISNNRLFGYPSEVVRNPDGTSGPYGPESTDPSCLYDAATGHFFLVELVLDTDSVTGDLTGTNHLDLAVSHTNDPTQGWNFYRIGVTDDGVNHGWGAEPSHPNCPCIGDYPHIGADANGIYLTTNEYSFFGPEFNGAQVYAMSKSALASGATSVQVTQIDTSLGSGHVNGNKPGFTLWPAQAPPGGANATDKEYFLSSNAAEEVGGNYHGNSIVLWTLTGSSTLAQTTPALDLQAFDLPTDQDYFLPPKAKQASGDWPLGQCMNLVKCSKAVNGKNDPYKEVLGPLDANDTRMQQVMYANGLVYGALDTAVLVGDPATVRAGVAWYAVDPTTPRILHQGQFGVAGADVTYPAIGVNSAGVGAMALTISGDSLHPGAAYVPLSGGSVTGGTVTTVGPGQGVQDGFSEYNGFGPPYNTPRWGDYGAAAVDTNGDIWLASEYIAQSCSLTTWLADPTCNNTRAPLGNWSTHIARVPAS